MLAIGRLTVINCKCDNQTSWTSYRQVCNIIFEIGREIPTKISKLLNLQANDDIGIFPTIFDSESVKFRLKIMKIRNID